MQSRRDFLKTVALAGLGVAIGPHSLLSASNGNLASTTKYELISCPSLTFSLHPRLLVWSLVPKIGRAHV